MGFTEERKDDDDDDERDRQIDRHTPVDMICYTHTYTHTRMQ